MKKNKRILIVSILLLILFATASVYTFDHSQRRISEGYLASEGNAAQNFAVLASANIHLTDEQVSALKAMSYAELMESAENQELKEMMSNDSFSSKVDYAYIMLHLKENEVKYTVTEENQDRYDAPIGTKLDIMWLLDVNVSTEALEHPQNAVTDEYNRYSYYIDEDALIFGESPTYIFNASEWGEHICGYAPIYSTSGKYIGVLGVELQTGDYLEYCNTAVVAMGILMSVSLAMLTLLYIYIYLKYRRIQFDKIYMDSLTQIYNRSYYNNRFIKVINQRRKKPNLAFMIIDVDYFKKVNDTFGHEVGDEVLAELAGVLISVFEKEITVRFGGEEFVVAAWFTDTEELESTLKLLFDKIKEHKFSTRELTLTVSLGCAWAEATAVNGWLLSGLLRAADCKLYEAKESGRNKYLIEHFDEKKIYKKKK